MGRAPLFIRVVCSSQFVKTGKKLAEVPRRMTATEVSGRVEGRSVFGPFSARRPSQGLKVGPNRVPTAPQEERKAPRGVSTRFQGPGHRVDVSDGVGRTGRARVRAIGWSPSLQRGGARGCPAPATREHRGKSGRHPQAGCRPGA